MSSARRAARGRFPFQHPPSRPPTFHIFSYARGMTRWAAWLLTLAGGTGVCLALYALVGQEIVSNIAEMVASTPRLSSTSTTLGQGSVAGGGAVDKNASQQPGPVGPQGPKGEPGLRGERGPPGERGTEGERGLPGPQGERGPAGPQGERGLPGPQGERGPAGPQGERGLSGPQGERGPAGPQGERGPVGPQGERGPPGPQGERGPAGPHGEPGPAASAQPGALVLRVLRGRPSKSCDADETLISAYCAGSAREIQSPPIIIPPRAARCIDIFAPSVVITCAKLPQVQVR